MARPSARKPLPAVIFLVVLSLLSALVWWRVIHRDDNAADSGTSSTTSAACNTTATKPVSLPKPASVTVRVLNGTTRSGLAATASSAFKARGFKVGPVGNDATSTATTTEIRYGPASAAAARLVQLYVPGAKLVPGAGATGSVVVALGASYKALATAAQVSTASKKVTSVPTC